MTRAEEDAIRDRWRDRIIAGSLPSPFRASAIVGDTATARAARSKWGTAYTRGTTRTRRRAAPVRVGGSRRSATGTAGGRDRGDPEPEPGRRRGDLVHVGELLPPLLDRLEQGMLDDDDAADLSWWLGGRP